jgi:hypothetical protein
MARRLARVLWPPSASLNGNQGKHCVSLSRRIAGEDSRCIGGIGWANIRFIRTPTPETISTYSCLGLESMDGGFTFEDT